MQFGSTTRTKHTTATAQCQEAYHSAMQRFGEKLRTLRQWRGLTVRALAQALGYRNHGFFVDLTIAEIFNKDVNFPYRLNDKANTFATLKNQRTNVLLTFGMKF